jgi:peptidoglycan/LPS O-acetylase OafA/YrhL
MQHSQRFVRLDLVRGASALAVAAYHLRITLFMPYELLPDHGSALARAFYFVTGLGHQAVMVFFVLSGFFVGGSVVNNGRSFRLRDYALARLTRLWIVLLPALLATAAIDAVLHVYRPTFLEAEGLRSGHSGPISLATFFANLFFLQSLYAPVFGTNVPLWSLAYEAWYYALFPLAAIALGLVGEPNRLRMRVVSALMFGALTWAATTHLLAAFPVWLLGVVVYWCSQRISIRPRRLLLLGSLLLFCVALVYTMQATWQTLVHLRADIAVALGFAPVCLLLARWPHPVESWLGTWSSRVSIGLSEFSYSFYLTHFPAIALFASLVVPDLRVFGAAGILIFCAWLAGLMGYGAVFWWVFERRTNQLRRALKAMLGWCHRSASEAPAIEHQSSSLRP